MTDSEKSLLAQHARELLDLGPSWVCHLVVRDIRGHWWVNLTRDCLMLGATIPVVDHAAWLVARAEPRRHPLGFLTHGQEPLPDDAHIAGATP
jgi:hypothetical protein